MNQAKFNKLVEKWDSELRALSDAFNDPFTWNTKCLEILESVEKRILAQEEAKV